MRKLKIYSKGGGLCHVIALSYNDDIITDTEHDKLLCEIHQFLHSKGWHSGDMWYPIKHPRLNASQAFGECQLWSRSTIYGRRRRATLAHLNKCLEELRNA